MYKNNSRFSSKFKACSPLQLLCNLTGMKPAIGYYSYTLRYAQKQKTRLIKKTQNEKPNSVLNVWSINVFNWMS